MKIRTLFTLATVLIFSLSLGASLYFFKVKVEANIQGRFFSEARSICTLLPQCISTATLQHAEVPLKTSPDLLSTTEKLADASHHGIQIRHAARFPNNKTYLANKDDQHLIDFFRHNRDTIELCQVVNNNTTLLRYSQPIFYQSTCYSCHNKEQVPSGQITSPAIVVVETPDSSLAAEKNGKFFALALINASGYLVAFICLLILLYFTVLKRLKALSVAAQHIKHGEYAHVSLPYYKKNNNELNLLTNAFGAMQKAIEHREVLLTDKNRQIYGMFHSHQSIMFLVDAKTYNVIDANQAAELFYALPLEALETESFYALHGLTQEDLTDLFAPCLVGKNKYLELPYSNENELYYLIMRFSPVKVNQKACLFIIVNDVTEWKKAENQIKKEHLFFQNVIDSMVDPVVVLDTERHIKKTNLAAKALADGILDENEEIFCYQAFQRANIPCNYNTQSCPMHTVLKTGKPASVIRHLEAKNKTFEIQASPYFDDYGNIAGIIESFRDISQRLEVEKDLIENERKIYDLTHYDDLTGLPNRSVLIDRLNQAIYHALYKNESLALLCLNIDRFKNINDTLGHHVGDILLQEIAWRLKKFKGGRSTLARNSGSEFFLLLEGVESEDAIRIANEVMATIKESFFADGYELITSCSLGVAFFPEHAENTTELMSKADVAMRTSKKEHGGDSLTVYEHSLDKVAPESLRLEADLKRAIAADELYLEYQPQFNLKDGALVGLEALVRWQHPTEGTIPPGAFIPLAEETGLIHELGNWVLRQAFIQATAWKNEDVHVVPIAVNVSSLQMKRSNFIQLLDQLLEEFNLDPELIELEITESAIMDRLETSMEALRSIRARGFKLAIDDFGTGYSSLSYLKSFPFSKLKVDRSFVMDLENDENDAAIITAILAMAKSLGLNTIAEGVENNYQRDFLIKHGCDEVQGFLYSRPVSATEVFNKYLRALA